MTVPLATPACPVAARPRRSVLQTAAGRRTALGVVLALAGVLYSVGLSASGWANSYYSAASQAGAQSWRAMLFGSLDPSGGITVDKPPAGLWLADLSVRVFGLSPQSLLLPQAACGVLSVGLLYGAVRRQALALGRQDEAAAAASGLLAAGILALTPVVTLMSRYNNPDALLVTLSVGAAYALVRAIGVPRGGGGWLALAGALLGLAFLTKLLQAWLVVPAFVTVALVAGAGSVGRRLARVLAAGLTMVAAAGWWVLLVQLTPSADRPWVGGSRSDSELDLALGYNGLGRLTGQESGGGAADVVHQANWFRLLGTWAPEASWLLPAALLALSAGWLLTRGRPRRDPVRAGLLLWGIWLIGAGAVLSSLRGISHSYYAVQLAPAVAGAVGLGGVLLWQRAWSAIGGVAARRVLVAGVAGTALWSAGLLLRRPSWPSGVALVVIAAAAVTVLGLTALGRTLTGTPPGPWPVPRATGPVTSPAAPEAFPAGVTPDGRRGSRRLVAVAAVTALLAGPAAWSVATAASVHRGANVSSGPGVTQVSTPAGYATGSSSSFRLPLALADTVRHGAAGFDWAAAVVGRRAADLQLASGAPVWSLGGYNGGDPYPTVAQFATAVAAHRVHYLVVYGALGVGPGLSGQVGRWAAQRGAVQHMGEWSLIDLTTSRGGTAPWSSTR